MTTDTYDKTVFSSFERRATISIACLYGVRMLGLFMVLPIIPIYIDDYAGATTLLLGVTLGIYGFTQAIFQIPFGLLSDKVGRRPVILAGLILFVLGSIVAGAADSVAELICGRALQGMGAIASTLMAMVTDFTAEQNRTKAMSAVGGSIGLSFFLAMIIGPIVASSVGLSGVFWLTALLGLLGIVIFWLTIPNTIRVQRNRETSTDLSHVFALLKDSSLMRLNLGIFCLHFVLMAAFVIIPVILSQELAVDEKNLWWVYLVLLCGSFVLMLPIVLVSEKKNQQKACFILSIAILIIAMLMLATQRGSLITPLMLLMFFLAFNALEAALPSWFSKVCPPGARGTAMGIYSTSQFLGAFAGGVIGGWGLNSFGIDGLFLLLAVILVVWLVIAFGMSPPRPLKTFVLETGHCNRKDLIETLSNINGVEDVLLVDGEPLAYVKVNRHQVDMTGLQPYLNHQITGEKNGAWS